MVKQLQLPTSIKLIRYECTDSTNDRAKELSASGAADGTLVWAGEQTSGRGRHGRNWHSPPGNLYCSLILRPTQLQHVTAGLSLIASLSIASVLDKFLPKSSQLSLKWPNDVLINGRKIAGVLLESSSINTDRSQCVIVGCGVNIASYPTTGLYPMTSLNEETGIETAVEQVLGAYVCNILNWIEQLRVSGFKRVRDAWLGRATGLGRPIRVHLGNDVLEGLFSDMDETGALLVQLPGGKMRKVTAGDVFFLS